jgi:hypothetical protein
VPEQEIEILARAYAESTPDNDPVRIASFIEGYKQALTKYKYTDTDLLLSITCAVFRSPANVIEQYRKQVSNKIPVSFESDIEKVYQLEVDGEFFRIKKRKNQNGKIEWVGKYLY